jgi:hypothetical protein
VSPERTFLTLECSLDGPRREAGLDIAVHEPDAHSGDLGSLLGVLLVRSRGLPGSPHLSVRQPTIRIGREPGNGIVLRHPSVSAEHAELRLRGGVWTLTDLGSLNGTWVDGEPVLGSLPVAPASEIRIGEVVLAFNPRDRWEHSEPVAAAEPEVIGRGVIAADELDAIAAPDAPLVPARHSGRVVFSALDYQESPASRSRSTAVWVTAGIVAVLLAVFLLLQAR